MDKNVVVRSNSYSEHVRHLNWLVHEETASSSLFCNTENLQTLVTSMLPKDVIPGLLSSLKCVRSLRLLSCGMEEIPEEIHNLIHLRYLNLCGNPLLNLPEKLCDLINLETLEVSWSHIRALLLSIGKLINLRHLISYETRYLNEFPQGYRKLSSSSDTAEICCERRKQFLKNLNQLRGTLNIIFENDLNREDVGIDIEKAGLKNEKDIKELELTFKNVYEVRADFLDSLSSPPNLEVLHICDLPGTRLPRWITSANYLKVISIYRCQNCPYLPSLGKLLFLENLEINWMGVTNIGREFLGLGCNDAKAPKDYSRNGFLDRAAQPSSSSIFVGFPKLVRLAIYFCGEWRVWEDLTEEDGNNIVMFPQYLGILNCKKFYTLPTRLLRMPTSLEVLSISICDTLVEKLEERGLSSFSKMSYLDSEDKISEFLRPIT